ncbi:pyridoxine 4-dehydrogenase [Scheffersomyces amazonensis]|uniref:pyridoxine 4-dehydrogenase n=1 Tax=Scheffersomyces amazonensis TaxID=1078765 RepID=UPI00315CC309
MSGLKPVELTGRFGFGTMSMTWKPVPPPTEQSLESLRFITSHEEFGTHLLNGGEFYGPNSANLKLLKQFVDSNPQEINEKLIISIKGASNLTTLAPDGSKDSITRSIENIISHFPAEKSKRPKLIFEISRVDPNVPYVETLGYIADYVKTGKIDGISLSEVGIESIKKAVNSGYPISCIEVELSLLTLDILNNGILAEAAEHQIPIIAYSPLCRGLLTDQAAESPDFLKEIPEKDMRHYFEKFYPENFAQNIKVVKLLYKFAHEVKKTSLESLALSWILKISGAKEYRGIKNLPKILPIPSGSTTAKIESNFGNIVELSEEDLAAINKILDENPIVGGRYNKRAEAHLNG